jgi:hypothetical protein
MSMTPLMDIINPDFKVSPSHLVHSVAKNINKLLIDGGQRLRCAHYQEVVEQIERSICTSRSAALQRDRLRAVFLFGGYVCTLVMMEKLLIVAALACQPGDRPIDLRGRLPHGLQFMEFVVSVEPFYSRFYIYHLGFPESFQQCCSNKPTSVLRVPVGDGRFCVRQSQPHMKWHAHVLSRPDIEM